MCWFWPCLAMAYYYEKSCSLIAALVDFWLLASERRWILRRRNSTTNITSSGPSTIAVLGKLCNRRLQCYAGCWGCCSREAAGTFILYFKIFPSFHAFKFTCFRFTTFFSLFLRREQNKRSTLKKIYIQLNTATKNL